MTVFSGALTLFSAYFLWKRSTAATTLALPETRMLFLETGMLTAALFCALRLPDCRRIRNRKAVSAAAVCLICALFLWLHQVFLPVFAAGLYLGYLIYLGDTARSLMLRGACGAVRRPANREKEQMQGNARVLRSTQGVREDCRMPGIGRRLLLGAGIQLIITAMFSLAGIGGVSFSRLQAILTAAAAAAVRCIADSRGIINKDTFQKDKAYAKAGFRTSREKWNCRGFRDLRDGTFFSSLILAVIMSSLLLQAGRLNIALDYDSLHYGLRSVFVLDNERGIYENLGSVNDVYVYPKGLEVLCLPLSGLAGGSFVTAFSWWLTAGTLGLVYSIVNGVSGADPAGAFAGESGKTALLQDRSLRGTGSLPAAGQRAGLYAVLTAACIPGIMNMGASAKTDAATLFFQLLCAGEFVRCFRCLHSEEPAEGKAVSFLNRLVGSGALYGLAAAVFTLILKPTSYLFSFLLAAAAGITALAVFRAWRKKIMKRPQNSPGQQACNPDFRGMASDAPEGIQDQRKVSGGDKENRDRRIVFREQQEEVIRNREKRVSFLLLCVSVLAFVLITLRTVRIAGVPVTTAGTSLWKLFGFELRYPFAGLNAAGAGEKNLLKRLIGVFACPVGEDMSHVYIAWGGLIPALCLLAVSVRKIRIYTGTKTGKEAGTAFTAYGTSGGTSEGQGTDWRYLGSDRRRKGTSEGQGTDASSGSGMRVSAGPETGTSAGSEMRVSCESETGTSAALGIGTEKNCGKEQENKKPGTAAAAKGYLSVALLMVLLASLACIARLNQVDGNYFMLLYALSVICAFAVPEEKGREAVPGSEFKTAEASAGTSAAVLFPAMLLGLVMCGITNWAGVPGLSPVKLIHRGYVNQIELDRQAQTEQGTGELYALLEADPTVRVLAMAEQPECFVYRCNVQSYTDLEGSGGNVYLVKTLVLFKEFLDYAKEDYILAEDSFLAVHSRAEQIVGYMLEDGSLTCVWEGGGMHLYQYHPGI